jgi:phospholipid/cholesterol/gamma-HCH transport system substrate-binding protein
MDSSRRTTIIAGTFVLLGLFLLFGLILEFGPIRHKMRRPYTVRAVFSDAQNLIAGSPVRRAGAVIGRVSTSPKLLDELKGVEVDLEIYQEFKIPKGAPLRINSIGLMGDCAVDIGVAPPGSSGFVADGETLSGDVSPDLSSMASKIGDEGTAVMKDIRDSLSRLNTTLDRLNTGVLSDENLRHVTATLTELETSVRKIDTEILSGPVVADLKSGIAAFRQTMESAASLTKSIDPAIVSARSALAKVDKAVDQLGPGLKEFGAASDGIRDAADALEGLLKDAHSGRGVLAAILNDPGVRDNLARLVANLRKSGIVFYKDKEPSSLPAPAPAPAPPSRRGR